MKKNYYLPFIIMIGMLFTGYLSFGQSLNSLNNTKKKDTNYIEQHQQMINNGVKAEVRAKTPGTSDFSTTPKKDVQNAQTEVIATYNYYHPRSIIYTDSRTPRYPLTGNKEQDIANYNKAKAVWMANNPQEQTAPVMTEKQAAERQLKGK